MHRLSALLRAAALCGCLFTLPAVAQDSGPPDAQQVQQNLTGLADRKLPAPEQSAAQDSLQQTLKLLDQRDQYVKQLADLRQQLAQAPQQIKDAQRQLRDCAPSRSNRPNSAMPAPRPRPWSSV